MRTRRGILWLLAGFALALVGGRWFSARYGEWAFFHSLGADAVWRSAIIGETSLRVTGFVIAFAFILLNLLAVRQSIVSLVLPRVILDLEFGEEIPTRRLTLFALLGAVVFASLFALIDQDWTVAHLAFSGERFGELDPYLERDLGFYVYWLPFERAWYGFLAVLVVVTSLVVLALYAMTPSIKWSDEGLYVSTWVRRHLGVLGGIAILLVSWGWRLDRFSLLTSGGAPATFFETMSIFSYFDHHVRLPYLSVLGFAAIPAALVFALTLWRGHMRSALSVATGLLLAGPVGGVVLSSVGGQGSSGDEVRTADRPYRSTRTLFTRRAFGVDAIARPETLQLGALEPSTIARYVSSWDSGALRRFVATERVGADVVALSWQGTPSGLEALLLRAVPADAPVGTRLPLDRFSAPGVDVFGAPVRVGPAGSSGISGILVAPGASPYVVVADTSGRLIAPRFETTFERISQAWDQQNPRLFAREVPSPRPRIMVLRDVRERVAELFPFFEVGPEISQLVHSDSLYWVAEFFVVAEEYPLAERLVFSGRGVTYVQHAATAVVQAQTGQVTVYPVQRPDPVTRSWMRRFPMMFASHDEAPAWLTREMPPAPDWAEIQGRALGFTGFFGDTIAVGAASRVDDADADLAGGPATFFQSGADGRSAWSTPVVDASAHVSGLLVARGGIAHGTEFHPLSSGQRWTTILERLQSAADSAGFGRALANSRRGRVQALPLKDGAMYAQSFYEWPPDGPPRLAGVVVLDRDRTRVGSSIASALGMSSRGMPDSVPVDLFRSRATDLYGAMDRALRAGDWRAYGDAWAALGRLLGRPSP